MALLPLCMLIKLENPDLMASSLKRIALKKSLCKSGLRRFNIHKDLVEINWIVCIEVHFEVRHDEAKAYVLFLEALNES